MRRVVKSGLFIKFLLGFSLVIAAGALIIVVSVRFSTRTEYTKVINRNDIQRAEELALLLASVYQETGDWKDIETLFERPGPGRMRRPGRHMQNAGAMYLGMIGQRFRIVISDETGRVVADSRDELAGEVLSGAVVKRGVPIMIEGRAGGAVFIGSMIEPVLSAADRGFLRSVNRGVVTAALVGFVLAFLVTLFFFKRITSPVLGLSEASKTVAAGDYSVRVDESGRDEFSSLAKTFNSMVEALQRSDEWKKRMIADAAHELRTPVSLIKANLEMILDDVYPLDKEQLISIHGETEKLGTLISELQTLSSAESGTLAMKREKVNLFDLLSKIVPLFDIAAQKKNVTIKTAKTGEIPVVMGDSVKLGQVVTNLLSNALRFSPEGSTIDISVKPDAKGVAIAVTDRGPGIPEDDQERIFERFYKIDTSRSQIGSGLGLAISREIVRAHGGWIRADSDGVSGTTFTVFLPFHKAIADVDGIEGG